MSETIVALATPPGRGALALVRLSGPESLQIVMRCLSGGALPARRPSLRRLRRADGTTLDQVVVTYFASPASYTGEDMVEISCHGSLPVVSEALELMVGEGARLAEPGEFTRRAFLNGKVDLVQAEAVRDLVGSTTDLQARVATEQLEGALSRRLEKIRGELVGVVCQLEARVEFVEEELRVDALGALLLRLRGAGSQLARLEESFRFGKVLREQPTIVIVGRPNSGKSSLFNRLLGEERAIVTAVPGTTRDAVSEVANISGVPARLVDTAGFREVESEVELLGVEKSGKEARQADVLIFVVDRAQPFNEEDQKVWRRIREQPFVLVLNKKDLPSRVTIPDQVAASAVAQVEVSALEGWEIPALVEATAGALGVGCWKVGEGLITNLRHKNCLRKAGEHLQCGIRALEQGLSEEFGLYDLRKALETLDEMTGKTTIEDLLDEIFSTFCVGK